MCDTQSGTPKPCIAPVRYIASLAFCVVVAGCADTNKQPTSQPLTADQRQQKILADPMNAGPNGELSNNKDGMLPDEKPSLKRDLDNFFNP